MVFTHRSLDILVRLGGGTVLIEWSPSIAETQRKENVAKATIRMNKANRIIGERGWRGKADIVLTSTVQIIVRNPLSREEVEKFLDEILDSK